MWISDGYVITAGDVAGGDISRFWSSTRETWELVAGFPRPASPRNGRPLTLRSVDIRVVSSTGGIKSGVRILLFTVMDCLDTRMVSVIKDGRQSSSHIVTWLGSTPLGAGLQWRLLAGSVVAGDQVGIGAGYE
jgi:hypothetical protein